MFKRLERKIQVIILLSMTIGIILLVTIAYASIRNIVLQHYQQQLVQFVRQASNNIQLHMNLIEETSKYAADDPSVQYALNTRRFNNSIIAVLDGIRISNLNIFGATLYCTNGDVYTSSNNSNIPSFSWLMDNELPASFLEDPEKESAWIVRHKSSSLYYTSYDNKMNGLLTYVLKIKDSNDKTAGYILVDTDITALHRYYQNTEGAFFQCIGSYIIDTDQTILPAPQSPELDPSLLQQNSRLLEQGFVPDAYPDRFMIVSAISNSNARILVTLSLELILQRLRLFLWPLILICFLFFVLSAVLSYSLAKSISLPLNALYQKMQNPL